MKNFWCCAVVCENGKYYAYALTFPYKENILSKLTAYTSDHLKHLYPCCSKKECFATVEEFNAAFKRNGEYLFDSPSF